MKPTPTPEGAVLRVPSTARAVPVLLLLVPALACGDGDGPSRPGGPSPVPEAAAAWLRAHAIPLERDAAAGGTADLEVLRSVVGDARVVALGEATHGTREFFLLKHRIVRFLVEEMGFDGVALEAPLPESGRVDDFVLGGAGDPERLLSGLYLWPWNSREMLDAVQWMRAHNQARDVDPVRFFGMDMQFPGMAIHEVKRFVARVDSGALRAVEEGMACLERFANDPTGSFPTPGYAAQLREAYRMPCRESLEGVVALLEENEEAYVVASSLAEFAWALRNARLAVQFEGWASSLTEHERDLHMADNVAWIMERSGPGGKLVVWAHDDHVANVPGSMGRALRQRFGEEVLLVELGLSRGTFNAAGPDGSPPGPHALTDPVAGSYGHYFAAAELPAFLLDLRGRDLSGPETSWLRGPRLLRSVGLDFEPTSPDLYVRQARLPEEFDVVVHVRVSRPTRLLPFRYPEEF